MRRSVVLAVTAWPALAGAAPSLTVEALACDGLDVAEVSRIMLLELSGEPDDEIQVSLRCGDVVRIELTNPTTARTAAREIARPATDDAERLIALAAVQLHAASWSELAQGPRPGAPARVSLRLPADPRSRGASPDDVVVSFSAGVRLRRLGMVPTVSLQGGIRATDRFMPYGRIGVEHAELARLGGRVAFWTTSAAVGAAHRLWPGRRGGIDVSFELGLVYLRLEGMPVVGFRGGVRDGLRAEAAAAVVPTLEARPLSLGLALSVGATFPSFEGDVPGEAAVPAGGWWALAALRIGIVN